MKQLLTILIMVFICFYTSENCEQHENEQMATQEVVQIETQETNEPEDSTDYEVVMSITYYTANDDIGMTGDGITASGTLATEGRTIAASQEYPFGTLTEVDGVTYVVEDRGEAITDNHLDIYVNDQQRAYELGRVTKVVKVKGGGA